MENRTVSAVKGDIGELTRITNEGVERLLASLKEDRKTFGRVLVADDEPDILLSLGRRLKFAGYDVLYAANGAEAIAMALHERPDLVILDIGMPCGDGHTVAQKIKSNLKTMITPVIYLTARTAQADRDKSEKLGAYAYITKPFKSEELLEVVDSAISGRAYVG